MTKLHCRLELANICSQFPFSCSASRTSTSEISASCWLSRREVRTTRIMYPVNRISPGLAMCPPIELFHGNDNSYRNLVALTFLPHVHRMYVEYLTISLSPVTFERSVHIIVSSLVSPILRRIFICLPALSLYDVSWETKLYFARCASYYHVSAKSAALWSRKMKHAIIGNSIVAQVILYSIVKLLYPMSQHARSKLWRNKYLHLPFESRYH